jgi:hypothetical protein
VKGRIMDNAAKPGLIEHEGLYRNLLTESTTQRPVYEGSEIDIPLTNINLDITQFNESYVELRPTINLNLSALYKKELNEKLLPNTDPSEFKTKPYLKAIYERIFIFVGWKAATDGIQSIRMVHNSKEIPGTEQGKQIVESYLYHRAKPECELLNCSGMYSNWRDVRNMDVSVCGTYISLYELAHHYYGNEGNMTIEICMVFPFDSFLLTQAFNVYPRFLFGDISLRVRLTTEAVVFAQVSPAASMSKILLEENNIFHNGKDSSS